MSGAWAVPGYRHVRPLGTGVTGEVFLGVHRPTEIPVAIKVLAPELLRDPAFVDRLRRDAQQLSELEDPGMVRLYEMYESADEPMGPPRRAAVVTELVDGVSMAQLLNSDGPVEPEAALVVLSRMLTALETAHRAGVLHRDVKPANVLVGGDGHPRLSDFGLAVHESKHAPAPGTPAYFAPELWDGGAATPRTDLYAATALFYECLSGESPYPSLNLLQLATAHRSAQIPMHGIPEPLRPIVLQGLAKGAGERAESAAALLDLVQAVAVATYGFGWEENGRAELESRSAVLRLLFPLSRPIEPDTGNRARTLLGAPPPDPATHTERAAPSEPGDRAGRQEPTRRVQDLQDLRDLPELTDLDPSPQRRDEYAAYSEYAGYADHIEHHEEHEGHGAHPDHDGHPGHDGRLDPGNAGDGDRGRPVPGGYGAEPKREAPAKGRSGGRRRISGGVLLAGLATVAVMLGGTGAAVYAAHAGGSSPDKVTVAPEQSDDEVAGGPAPEPGTGDYTSGPVARNNLTPSGSPTASATPSRRKPTPPGTPSGSPPGSPPSGGTPPPGGGGAPPPPSTPATEVSGLTVTWNRSGTSGTGTGTVTVTTTGTGTVNLAISYFEDGEAAGTETIRLSGSRSYTRQISRTADDRCAPQSVTVSSDPAAPGGSESGSFKRNPECWWLP